MEHPPVYTAGIHTTPSELISPLFPVFQTNRGGKLTYHGPGQRIFYAMINLNRRKMSPKEFICNLEETGIRALADLGITAERRPGRVGLWVVCPDGRERKIAAVGIRVRHGVTFHGMSLNICPDLSHFSGIIPCGLSSYGITSMQELGKKDLNVRILDDSLIRHFSHIFDAE